MITLFVISLIGWKRAIHGQKVIVLDEIRERRKILIKNLKAKEKLPDFKIHSFSDIAELNFLNEQ